MHVSSVLQLKSVVVGACVVLSSLLVHALSNVVGGEAVDDHEGDEVGTVATATEHVLVEQEVGAEEEHQGLQVDDRRVLGSSDDARVSCFHLYQIVNDQLYLSLSINY